jgi:hypothetical protein
MAGGHTAGRRRGKKEAHQHTARARTPARPLWCPRRRAPMRGQASTPPPTPPSSPGPCPRSRRTRRRNRRSRRLRRPGRPRPRRPASRRRRRSGPRALRRACVCVRVRRKRREERNLCERQRGGKTSVMGLAPTPDRSSGLAQARTGCGGAWTPRKRPRTPCRNGGQDQARAAPPRVKRPDFFLAARPAPHRPPHNSPHQDAHGVVILAPAGAALCVRRGEVGSGRGERRGVEGEREGRASGGRQFLAAESKKEKKNARCPL